MPYEYLDHTADVQLRAWGGSLKEAFEQAVVGMFGYMTDLSTVKVDPAAQVELQVEGHDLKSLLYAFMDAALFQFSANYVVIKSVEISTLDTAKFVLHAVGHGEQWDAQRHPQGTEVKAITFSNMQIHEEPGNCSVYVIVDI